MYNFPTICQPIRQLLTTHLCDNSRVRRDLQISSTSERLSTSLHINQVQAGAKTLVVLKVLEELQQITREASNGRRSNEAVNSHATVGTNINLPRDTVDSNSGDRRTSRRNRTSTAQRSKPDHNLILLASASARAQEHVVGDISDDIGVGVATRQRQMSLYRYNMLQHSPPLESRLDTANGAQLLSSKLQRHVGETLNLVRSTRPRPRTVPGDRASAERVNASTLLAGGIVALTPEVVVDDVATGRDRAPLVAEVCATSKSLGRDGGGAADGGQRQRKERERSEGLHVGLWGMKEFWSMGCTTWSRGLFYRCHLLSVVVRLGMDLGGLMFRIEHGVVLSHFHIGGVILGDQDSTTG